MTNGHHKRMVVAIAAVGLAGGSLGAVAPAAAVSAALGYTCTILGQSRTFTMVADTDAPARIGYGQTVEATATGLITVPEDVTTVIRNDLNAKRVAAQVVVSATVNDVPRPWTLVVPQTIVPPNGSLVLEGTGPAGTFAGTTVGTVYQVDAGSFAGTLTFYDANGTPSSPVPSAPVSCALNPGQDPAADTITVVKDGTTTKVKSPDIAKGGQALARVKVISDHGKTVRGKIRAKVFHNGKRLLTKQVSLRDGSRKVKLLRPSRSGTYTVRVKYLGHPNFKGSSGSDTFTVS